MKVVQINSVCGIGSTGRISVNISKKLNDNNIENYIIYGVYKSDYPQGIKIGGQVNLRSHQIGTRIFGKHGFYSKTSTEQIIKKLKEINPDIIHLHNIHGHYINIEILFNYLVESKKKVVWTLHDCWGFTGHCAHFEYIGCVKWKDKCNKCPQLKEYPKSLIFDRSEESYYDKKRIFTSLENMILITPSQWLANLVKQSLLSEYPIKVINNGIDLNEFKPSENEFRAKYNLNNKFIILGVTNVWEERKGFSYFINLSKKLVDNEVIVMVGLTGKQIKHLPNNIIGIERTNSTNELADIYSSADVFINPTLEDNFPTTNIEALACGTPVVTFNTGGSSESIDGLTGISIEKGNFNELRKAIEMVKKQGKHEYSENCVNRAKQFYNKDDRYLEYIKIYQGFN